MKLPITLTLLFALIAQPAFAHHHVKLPPKQPLTYKESLNLLPPKTDVIGRTKFQRRQIIANATHRIRRYDAISRWYFVFKSHCGNGSEWICYGTSVQSWYLDEVGTHSWYINWQFFEGKLTALLKWRGCTILGRLKHTTVEWWDERCGPERWRWE